MQNEKFKFGKLFLIGFGFFGVSVLWSLYNTYVPILLEQKFALDAAAIGFFMSLDNIAALLFSRRSARGRTGCAPSSAGASPSFGWRAIAALAFGLVPLANSRPCL